MRLNFLSVTSPDITKMKKSTFTLIVAAIAMAGCTTVYTPEHVYADKDTYAADVFSLGKFRSDSKKYAAMLHKPVANFKTLTVKLDAKFDGKSSRIDRATGVTKFTNLGHGLARAVSEFSNNDIPYSLNFNISYLGLFSFRNQNIAYRQTRMSDVGEVRNISKFSVDAWNPVEGRGYEFNAEVAPEGRLAGFDTFTSTCTAGKSYPARTVFPSLQGQAVDFQCDKLVGGRVTGKANLILLQDYGVALPTSKQDSLNKASFTVVSVEVN